MDALLKKFYSIVDFIKGFLEFNRIKTPRYCFTIEKINLVYHQSTIRAKVDYTPIGCYRPYKNFVSELNDIMICRKFKPAHARIIIGIHTLESTLDLQIQEHLEIYLNFVKSCINFIYE